MTGMSAQLMWFITNRVPACADMLPCHSTERPKPRLIARKNARSWLRRSAAALIIHGGIRQAAAVSVAAARARPKLRLE
ncbi:hypothetical protein [Sphingomonas sp. IC081]|uniref:hypothetical protein n=1 Tax=Sphingomonas sp. IC081 TaxID=304378 RepID=UPI001C8DCEEB|nr:hypothetical protein [Sphingomonas sp. IC081]